MCSADAPGVALSAFLSRSFFAIHPANVENVAWASERKSLLNTVFWFWGTATFITFLERRTFRWYGITVILFLLSLFCKPMSVTLPCALFLIYCWREIYLGRGRENFRWLFDADAKKIALLLLPMVAISVYFSWVTTYAQTEAMCTTQTYPISKRLINVLVSYKEYLSMYFNPRGLAIFYPLFISKLVPSLVVVPLLLLASITALVTLLSRRVPELLIGWLWFLGTMVPVVGLVQVGSQSHADRYLYIPMLGLSFLLPTLLNNIRIPARLAAPVTASLLAVIAAVLIPATYIQVGYWQDGITLFRHSIDITGDCLLSVSNVAIGYSRFNRNETGIKFIDLKLKVAQTPTGIGKLNSLKAVMLLNSKRYKECIEAARTAFDLGDNPAGNAVCISWSSYQLHDFETAKKYMDISEKLQAPVADSDYIAAQMKFKKEAFSEQLKSKLAASDRN